MLDNTHKKVKSIYSNLVQKTNMCKSWSLSSWSGLAGGSLRLDQCEASLVAGLEKVRSLRQTPGIVQHACKWNSSQTRIKSSTGLCNSSFSPANWGDSVSKERNKRKPLTFRHCPKKGGGVPTVLGYFFLAIFLDITEERGGLNLFQKFLGSFGVVLR